MAKRLEITSKKTIVYILEPPETTALLKDMLITLSIDDLICSCLRIIFHKDIGIANGLRSVDLRISVDTRSRPCTALILGHFVLAHISRAAIIIYEPSVVRIMAPKCTCPISRIR